MSGIDASIAEIKRVIAKRINRVAPFRAIVTAVDGSMIAIRRIGATTAEGRKVASCSRFVLNVGDEVLVATLNGEPVVIDRIRRSTHTPPTFTKQTGAGTTGVTTGSVGNDMVGMIQLVPGGTGIASGAQVVIAFAEALPNTNYIIQVQPASSAARTAGASVGPTGRTTGQWTLTADSALASGSTFQWFYERRMYPA